MRGSKRTPGPWKVESLITGDLGVSHQGRENYVLVAKVHAWSAHPGEGEANAKLIAAAPDLLDAAEEVLKMYPEGVFTGESGDDGPRRVIALRQVVERASG